MKDIEKRHWNDLKDQLTKWGFKETDDTFIKGYDYYWARPDEDDADEIMYTMFLYFDKTGNFFTMELSNEHGHYADNPLPNVISIVDVIDFWKATTGKQLKEVEKIKEKV